MARRNILSGHIPQILSMPSSPTTARENTLSLFHARFLLIYSWYMWCRRHFRNSLHCLLQEICGTAYFL